MILFDAQPLDPVLYIYTGSGSRSWANKFPDPADSNLKH